MPKIFCDSGAFSAHHNNTTVNIQDYINFIKKHDKEIETYANLDSIGSAEKTWINQKIMEDVGLKPIPVYHLGEPELYLKKCLEYPYFAVGGIASKLTSPGGLGRNLDQLFMKICPKSNDFYPTHKIHGFGIATPQLLIKYPWYSVDTTSWAQYGRFGIILIPAIKYGKIKYDLSPRTLTISTRSKAVGDAEHFIQLNETQQEPIIEYCEEKGCPVGKSFLIEVGPGYVLKENEKWTDRKLKNRIERIEEIGLCCDGEMRDKINLEYFLDLEKNQRKYPFQFFLKEKQLKDKDGNSLFD